MPATEDTAFSYPPAWAKEAIWYQIFIERFRNGNKKNDPTKATCEGALTDVIPDDWEITPWGNNWYKQEEWAKKTGLPFYRSIQMRRYGGDLDGVFEKLPYLKKLGINAIYFNPLNDAPSLHKYDARNYHHIDVTLGDDPEEDLKQIQKENPGDPATWTWTSADKKFINLVKKLHEQDIKVVLDFSWNHTGTQFWAFKDIVKNKNNSPYKDWYDAHFNTDAETGAVDFTYEGWLGISSLPELKKVDTKGKLPGHPYEGNLHPDVKEHIFAVCKRWMDPNGDGIFDDGIDGMRLDVAEHVPMGFWREFRAFVRSLNPDFYLVGENWWTKFPDELMDPAPWVKGDVFDAVMHYQWYKVARGYFAQPEDRVSLKGFQSGMDSLFLKYPPHTRQAMMNLGPSHDAPRLLTCFGNPLKYKFMASTQEYPEYKTNKPSHEVYQRVKLYLLHQYTFVGSPHIWNGDEMGMTGAHDPDCRKPLPWEDIIFEDETQSPTSSILYKESISFDQDMFDYVSSLIQLRKSSKTFSLGDYNFVDLGENENVLAYTRTLDGQKYLVVFNVNPEGRSIDMEKNANWQIAFSFNGITRVEPNRMDMAPFSGAVLKRM